MQRQTVWSELQLLHSRAVTSLRLSSFIYIIEVLLLKPKASGQCSQHSHHVTHGRVVPIAEPSDDDSLS